MRSLAAFTLIDYFYWWQVPICAAVGLILLGGLIGGIVVLIVRLARRRRGDG